MGENGITAMNLLDDDANAGAASSNALATSNKKLLNTRTGGKDGGGVEGQSGTETIQ